MVYKICQLNGVPRIKLSEEAEKTTIPAKKVVVRAYDGDKPVFDILCLASELESLLAQPSPIALFTQSMEHANLHFTRLQSLYGDIRADTRSLAEKRTMTADWLAKFGEPAEMLDKATKDN